MILGQLHLNIGVGWADGRRGRVGEIQAGVRHADVIEDGDQFAGRNLLADGGVDPVAERGCFLDAHAGGRTQVNLELPGVHRGKEVLAQPWRQQANRTHGKEQEEDEKDSRVVHAEGEQAQVAAAKALKAGFETALKADEWVSAGALPGGFGVVVLFEQVLGHGGDQGAGEEVAGQHGEDHRLGHGDEEVPGHAAEEEHGHEDDADGQGGDQGRDGDLRGAVEDGLLQLLAGFEVAVDVLDGDGGVVDKNADGQRKAAQSHDVDGLVQHGEHAERTEDGERNGDRDDDGGAPTAQEDQDHDGSEAGGDDGLADHAVDGAADKDRLIGELPDFQLRGQLALDAFELFVHPVDDVQRGGRAGLHDGHHDGAAAVHAHDVGLRRIAVAHVGHVADVDDRAVDRS